MAGHSNRKRLTEYVKTLNIQHFLQNKGLSIKVFCKKLKKCKSVDDIKKQFGYLSERNVDFNKLYSFTY